MENCDVLGTWDSGSLSYGQYCFKRQTLLAGIKELGLYPNAEFHELDNFLGDEETQKYQSVGDIPQEEIKQFIMFYAEVARQKQKTIEISGFEDKDKAIDAIKRAIIRS